jgi:UDP-2-acetamido-2,6-beta-L-arabino-hexul-4-ose reductase
MSESCRVLVTGARGFIGRNLIVRLGRLAGVEVAGHDLPEGDRELETAMSRRPDVIYHLAGVNRPDRDQEFEEGNVRLTGRLAELASRFRVPRIVFSSSTQAAQDTAYGRSKRDAEELLWRHAEQTGAAVLVYRLANVFGKWSRPNYNSVVATFCHNLAHDLPIAVNDPVKLVTFVYIDDVVAALAHHAERSFDPGDAPGRSPRSIHPEYPITLGDLAARLEFLRDIQRTGVLPNLADPLNRYLFATYLSYLPPDKVRYELAARRDDRGWLAELVKSPGGGQMFVSVTRPGITRGNHYHDTKIEKFCVVQGDALIALRSLADGARSEYRVHGGTPSVVDIPPGCAHAITNVGSGDLVTLFWADEPFDPAHPDTYPGEVT